MNKDDIVRIYMQVSDELCDGKEWCWHGVGEPLQLFAALVAAAEREACAKVCEGRIGGAIQTNEWWSGFKSAMKQCAEVIRARSKA